MAEEKEVKEMSEEEMQALRSEVAAEEFGDSPPVPSPATKLQEKPEEKKVEELKPSSDEPKEEPKPEEDVWTGVNPALKESFDTMAKKIDAFDLTLPGRLKQAEQRIGSLTNDLHVAKKAAEVSPQPPAPTKEEQEKAAGEKEDWEELKVEYPDWANAVESRLAHIKKRQEDLDAQPGTTAQHMQEELQNLRSEVGGMLETAMLGFRHAGWEKTITTPEYQKWLIDQPEDVKQLTVSPFAKDAITVLDKFQVAQKDKKPETSNEKQQRLAQSVSMDGVRPKPQKAESDMTDEELRKKYASELWA